MATRLIQYQNLTTQDTYYGYPVDEATIKSIDGDKYIEVINDLKHPKQMWVKVDSIKPVKEVYVG